MMLIHGDGMRGLSTASQGDRIKEGRSKRMKLGLPEPEDGL